MKTRVGYAGGTKRQPTYHSLGDHTESFQVDFDPTVVTFAELAEHFWRSHDPTEGVWSRQYMSIGFYADEAQRQVLEEAREHLSRKLGKPVQTRLAPLDAFWLAEGYHQKYYLRHQRGLMREFIARDYSERDFVDSTVAARLNAYVAGCGHREQLESELPAFGLSAEGLRQLEPLVGRSVIRCR